MGVGGIEAPPATTGLGLRLRGGARGSGAEEEAEDGADELEGEPRGREQATAASSQGEPARAAFTNAGRTARRSYTTYQWDQLGAHGGYLDHAISTLDAEAFRPSASHEHTVFTFMPAQDGRTLGVSWTESARRAPQGEPPPPPRAARPVPPYWDEHPAEAVALPAAAPPPVHPALVPVQPSPWNVGRIQPGTHLSPDMADTLTIMSVRDKAGLALYLYDFPPKVHDTPNIWTSGGQVMESAVRRVSEFVQRETNPEGRWPRSQRVSLAQSIMRMAVTMHTGPRTVHALFHALSDRGPPGVPAAHEVSYAAHPSLSTSLASLMSRTEGTD